MTVTFAKLGQYGRMCNQFFQIAATVSLAIDNGDSFLFPRWEYSTYFNLPHNVFVERLPKFNTYEEPCFHHTPISYRDNINLHGYFQSEKYFKNNSALIKQYLTPGVLKKSDACSIHVRRTDYLIHTGCYEILDMAYYEKAIKESGANNFIVFSDDIAWCKSHFIGNNFEFSEEPNPAKDLANMIGCTQGHIIANSSFSWWGAWLGAGKVIAPKKWFGQKLSPTHNTKDLYPNGWVKI